MDNLIKAFSLINGELNSCLDDETDEARDFLVTSAKALLQAMGKLVGEEMIFTSDKR